MQAMAYAISYRFILKLHILHMISFFDSFIFGSSLEFIVHYIFYYNNI